MPASKEAINNPDRGAGGCNFIYPWKFWTKQSFFHRNSAKFFYTHWKFRGQKLRSLETPHDILLITILFFFNKPLEILHAYFFDTTRNFRNKLLLLL